MSEELLPCPFCGNKYVRLVGDPILNYFVICTIHSNGCGASASRKTTEQGAIKAWNRRSCECANNAAMTPGVAASVR